jgi:hypothetical protein
LTLEEALVLCRRVGAGVDEEGGGEEGGKSEGAHGEGVSRGS